MVSLVALCMTAIQEPANESFALCLNLSLVVTCCSSTTAWALRWIITPIQGGSTLVIYTNISSLEDVKMIGDFVVRLESNSPLVSTVTLDEVDSKYNGTVLSCMTYTSQGYEEFTQTTILVVKGILLIK